MNDLPACLAYLPPCLPARLPAECPDLFEFLRQGSQLYELPSPLQHRLLASRRGSPGCGPLLRLPWWPCSSHCLPACRPACLLVGRPGVWQARAGHISAISCARALTWHLLVLCVTVLQQLSAAAEGPERPQQGRAGRGSTRREPQLHSRLRRGGGACQAGGGRRGGGGRSCVIRHHLAPRTLQPGWRACP
jgi:hypothetical protein